MTADTTTAANAAVVPTPRREPEWVRRAREAAALRGLVATKELAR